MCWLRVWQCADQLLIELTKNSLLVFWWWLVRAEVVVWGLRSALHIHRETNFDGIRLNFRCYISLYRLRGQLETERQALQAKPLQKCLGKTCRAKQLVHLWSWVACAHGSNMTCSQHTEKKENSMVNTTIFSSVLYCELCPLISTFRLHLSHCSYHTHPHWSKQEGKGRVVLQQWVREPKAGM